MSKEWLKRPAFLVEIRKCIEQCVFLVVLEEPNTAAGALPMFMSDRTKGSVVILSMCRTRDVQIEATETKADEPSGLSTFDLRHHDGSFVFLMLKAVLRKSTERADQQRVRTMGLGKTVQSLKGSTKRLCLPKLHVSLSFCRYLPVNDGLFSSHHPSFTLDTRTRQGCGRPLVTFVSRIPGQRAI